MDYDRDKVDEMTLALMYLVMSRTPAGGRASKVFDLQTMVRLQQKGWVANLQNKSATLEITEEGLKRAEKLFREHFVRAQT